MDAYAVKRATLRWCRENKLMAVTECSLHRYSNVGNSDVVGMKLASGYNTRKPCKYLAEFEVKVTKNDLRKDLQKKRWYFWSLRRPSTHLWYVVPESLQDEALLVAAELERLLRGEAQYGNLDKNHFAQNPISKRARVGVLACKDEYCITLVKRAVRVQSVAPPEAVDRVVGRSFWELYGLRNLHNQYQDRALDIMQPGDIWVRLEWKRGPKPRVKIVKAEKEFVHYENTNTGRKGRSKVSSFITRYKPTRWPVNSR